LIESVNVSSDVFIVSQSLAAGQLRKSGVNFFDEKGVLGNTGKNLEKFLNLFSRTVFPPVSVKISENVLILKCNPN